jgi:hypothetical protein
MEMRVDENVGAGVPKREGLDVTQIAGSWSNTDRGSSGGTLRLVVSGDGDDLRVRGFGVPEEAQGEPIDWGETGATALAQGVDGSEAWAFRCAFDLGFMTTVLAAYGKEGILIAASYNRFTDGSGRADYWTREFFYLEREE